MIERYENSQIKKIWSNQTKLELWQGVELAVIAARERLSLVPVGTHQQIHEHLIGNNIDVAWWLKKEEEVHHDLNAFLDERLRFLPADLGCYFHNGMTSYDTEEPAFATMIKNSMVLIQNFTNELGFTLVRMAKLYRYTIMNGRTHGQEAELQSFGKRCLTWLQSVKNCLFDLERTAKALRYSKLSGAIGNWRGLDPKVEEVALDILGFTPFYGATQIMPRELYAPIAQSLTQLVLVLQKIALDIRLGARSGRPIYQEPFGKKQKGSSAMPGKKNTIGSEQVEGMARLAKGYLWAIMENIVTWEERAIEQSSVERVAWPDLFHVTAQALKVMNRILNGLVVYPDHMLMEILECRGCYAASEAKDFLRQEGAKVGLSSEDAYRIVQLAAFNAFGPELWQEKMRDNTTSSLQEADTQIIAGIRPRRDPESIETIIPTKQLRCSPQLDATQSQIDQWHEKLGQIFDLDTWNRWNTLFTPSHLLRNEAKLYEEILGQAS